MRPADFTLTAGPSASWPEVMAAMGQPIIYDYDPSFLETFRRTTEKIAEVFDTKEDVLIMQGEAVLGLEAAGRACVRPGMKVINLVSGVYGKGMSDWLKMWGADLIEIAVPYDEAVPAEAVEKALDDNPGVELVAVVHSETPSGTLNPIKEIGPLVRAHGAVSLVDCVSSLGGMPVLPDEWQLDICVTGAQKCLCGPPGITPIRVSKQAWELIEKNPDAPRWSFISLLDWRQRYLAEGRFPFTPSVSDVFGLEASLDVLLRQGIDESIAQHTRAAQACRAGVKALGLKLWPKTEDIMSTCTTAVAVPDGLDHKQVRQHVRERYGVQISDGHGAGNLVRIGHMGLAARSLYPVVGVAALGQGLRDLGVKVDVGAGVEEALRIISEAAA